jgi:aspartate aminotransferase
MISTKPLIFDDQAFVTLAEVEPRLMSRTLTMNGVSKAYAMTGWRIGFATGPRWLPQPMEKLQGQQTSGPSSISQQAALAALTGPKDFIYQSRVVFQRRRDLMVSLLDQIPGLSCEAPGGAFYAFACCAGLIGRTTAAGRTLRTDEDVALALLEEANVAPRLSPRASIWASYTNPAYLKDKNGTRRQPPALPE